MSLNMAHEIVATRNAARASASGGANKSKHRRRRSDYTSPEPKEGRSYDDDNYDDWWAREMGREADRLRHHAYAHRDERSRHRDARDSSRGQGNELEKTMTTTTTTTSTTNGERERKQKTRERESRHVRDWSDYRAEAEQAERYDYYRPYPIYRRSRRHKHKHRRSRDEDEIEAPISPRVMVSPSGGIGAAIAAAAGIAGGIVGVENELEGHNKPQTDEIEMKPQKPWSVWDVKKSREYRKNTQGSNLASLTSLANHFTDMTTTLDSTYSSLFDKLTNLHGAIYAFKDLLDITTELRSQTNTSVTNLKTDAEERIASLNNFESQITKIDDLQKRMTESRNRAAALNKRLDNARETIAKWQQNEHEWNITLQKRLKFGTSVAMGAVAVIIMFCFLRIGWSSSEAADALQHVVVNPVSNLAQTAPTVVSSAAIQLEGLATVAERLEPVDVCLNSVAALTRGGGG